MPILGAQFLFAVLPIALSVPLPTPTTPLPAPPPSRFHLTNLHAAHYSETSPVPPSLFGPPNPALSVTLPPPNIHPRVITTPALYTALLSRHAATHSTSGTWSASLKTLTASGDLRGSYIQSLASLDLSAFTGRAVQSLSPAQLKQYQSRLRPLAALVRKATEAKSHALFLCSFWAGVSDVQAAQNMTGHGFLGPDATPICKRAVLAWATVLMAHRVVHCPTPEQCKYPSDDVERGFLWDTNRKWEVNHDWYTSGLSLALAYDVLHAGMTEPERTVVRSALALLVMNRWTWGTSDTSDRNSPNAQIHPHRIYGNWALYHSNLFLTNLAIEGESGLNLYASYALQVANSTQPFNEKLHQRFAAMISAFMVHTFNPDGSTFEDGYTYHTALREGSLALLAAHLRGTNVLNTPRFRNLIHNAAQMWEPWQCSPLLGHASGGGLNYNAYVSLFRYAYPNGPLPQMMWKQRFGPDFDNDKCRIYWTQTMTQLTFFGDDHSSPDVASAPETLSEAHKKNFPLAYVSTRRGLIVTRASYAERASYMHFDPRPDSFFLGHDNADRGIITFSALGRRWLDDLDWSKNFDSRRHSLMHVDGLAQAVKAPSVTIMKVHDDKSSCISAADLTYAYNVLWARSWQGPSSGRSKIKEYDKNGNPRMAEYYFTEAEDYSPWDLGWPMEDDAEDIGFNRSMTLNGYPDLLFGGLHQWKRSYRMQPLSHMIRSTIMVRSAKNEVGFGVVVDSVASDDDDSHVFESYLILQKDVFLDSFASECNGNKCKISLKSPDIEQLDIHVRTISTAVSFREEDFDGNNRLIIKSSGLSKEEFWIAFHPHDGSSNGFKMFRQSDGRIKFTYEGEDRFFAIDKTDYTVIETNSQRIKKVPKQETKLLEPRNSQDLPSKLGDVESSVEPPRGFDDAVPNTEPSNEMEKTGPCNNSEAQSAVLPSITLQRTDEDVDLVEAALPMQPISLDFSTWRKIEFANLSSEKRTFFQTTRAQWQVVFNFTSFQEGNRLDSISTCRSFTNAETRIAVYDCGIGSEQYMNYKSRACKIVEESDDHSICLGPDGQQNSNITVMLVNGKMYYAVVSVFGRSDHPRFIISHKLVWAGLG